MAVPEGPADQLVGREAELRLGLALASTERLVTLVGTGGVGKTRLAEELATRLRAAGREVVLVPLRAISDVGLLAAEVASALHLAELPEDESHARLTAELRRHGELSLVLDNLEQLPGAGSAIARLTVEAPSLHVLATSRMPLGAAGEHVIAVEPLPLPASDRPEDVAASPAGKLFLARASEHRSFVPLDTTTAADIAVLCRRLDGLPLAIELAAGRSRLLGPGAILRRLQSEPHGVLERPGDGGPHRSLDSVLAWSLGLLGPDERRLALSLGIFVGHFDIAAAAAMCPDIPVLDGLEKLVAHALVRHEDGPHGEPRFWMLETVRLGCLGRIDPEEHDELRRRHLGVMARLVEAERENLLAPGRTESAARLEDRIDDIRVAFDTALEAGPPLAIGLVADVWRFWLQTGRGREAIRRLRLALDRVPRGGAAEAKARSALAGLRLNLEGSKVALADAQEAIRIARRLGDAAIELDALPAVTLAATAAGDLARSRRLARRSVALARRTGDRRALVRALATLGIAEGTLGDPRAGVRRLEEAIAEARAANDPLNEGIQLANLAELELALDHLRAAAEHAAAAASVLRTNDGGTYLASAVSLVGLVLTELGRLREARVALLEAAGLATALDDPRLTAELFARSVPYLGRVGGLGLAGRAWASARRLDAAGVVSLAAPDRRLAERALEKSASTVEPWGFDAAMRGESVADPAGLLAELAGFLARPQPVLRTRGDPAPSVLTPREAEILRLLGRGLTDAQIANALGISAKTASVHVSNVKSKLGVDTRLEAAISGRALMDATDSPPALGDR